LPDGSWGTELVWQTDVRGTHLAQNDHLHTSVALTSSTSGERSWEAVRQSFGATAVSSESQTEYFLRFPGQYYDFKSEMSNNYYRDYYQETGMYVSAEPVSLRAVAVVYSRQNPITRFDNLGLWEVENTLPDKGVNTIYCDNGVSQVQLEGLYPSEKGRCLNDGIILHENIHKSRFDRSPDAGKCRRFKGKAEIFYTNDAECDNEERIGLKDQREHYQKKLEKGNCPECERYLTTEIQYISNMLAQTPVPICTDCFNFYFEGGKLKCVKIVIGPVSVY